MAVEQWDQSRYQFVRVVMPNLRAGGQLELHLDTKTGIEFAVKRFPWAWVRDDPEAFRKAHASSLENPWDEFEVSQRVGLLTGACKCYGAFRDTQGDMLLAMEYLPGGDLFDFTGRLGEPGLSREQQAWPVIRSLLRAVFALHGIGVAHGDISLENALLRAEGGGRADVVLIDFEAARVGLAAEKASGSRGKASYQAPEMHCERWYDARAADLFSCGVLAYGLALGDYPWDSTKPGACPKFTFAQKYGIAAFLSKRCVVTRGEKRFVADCMSHEWQELLCTLLHPVPEKRFAARLLLKKGTSSQGMCKFETLIGA